MRAPSVLIGLWLTLIAATGAHAQHERFTDAVMSLVGVMESPAPSQPDAIRMHARRMAAALAEWDSTIAALEARAGRQGRSTGPHAPSDEGYRDLVALAVAYRVRGRDEDALRGVDSALALRPSSVDLHVLRAQTLEDLGRSGEAEREVLSAFALARDSVWEASSLMRTPGAATVADVRRARDVVEAAYLRAAADGDTHPSIREALQFQVLTALPDTLRQNPVVGDDMLSPVFELLASRRYADAVDALTTIASEPGGAPASGEAPSDHMARGRVAESENRIADARREYTAALRGTLVGRRVILAGLGRLAQVDGDHQAAVEAFRQAVRLNPTDAHLRQELAAALVAAERHTDAFVELAGAVLINPRDAQAHAAVAQLWLDHGRFGEAVTAFGAALRLAPQSFEWRHGLATALARLGRADDAARERARFEQGTSAMLARRRREIADDVARQQSVLDQWPGLDGR